MSDAGGGRRGLKRRSGDQVIKGNVRNIVSLC